MAKSDRRQIPAAATHFAAGPFRFVDTSGDHPGVPVFMRLRGLEPVNHWYWGQIVHDMAGLSIHKDHLPVDYCHDPEQILGYLDTFKTEAGLEVSGWIFPEDDPRADEVYRKHSRGIPYESSMDWADPDTVLEWIPEGVTTAVNENAFSGPGYVVRKWSLRGAAICPYGADKYATTNFGAGDTVGLTLFSKGELPDMPKTTYTDAAGAERRTLTTIAPAQDTEGAAETPPATPAETAETPPATPAETAETPPATPAETPAETTSQDARKAEGQRFKEAFGSELGARLFADGLTWAEAQSHYNAHMRDEVAKLTAQIAEKESQIAALRDKLGESSPVSFIPEFSGDTPNNRTVVNDTDSNLRRFVAGIKLPSTN